MRNPTLLLTVLILGCNASQSLPQTLRSAKSAVSSEPIRILAWNVESGGSDPSVIASQLAEFDHDIIALSEVAPNAFDVYANATGMQQVDSESGRNDRLQILCSDRFKIVSSYEVDEINDGNHRAPLVAHLRDNETGQDLQLVVNHLARTNADFREEQANKLRKWGREQTLPTIAIGDFNFDYSFISETGNSGFAAMLRDNVWLWVKPAVWIDTNWSDRKGDGVDDYPDSMLDFAFVAGEARDWSPACRVIEREGDFPDDKSTSDHRPIELTVLPQDSQRRATTVFAGSALFIE